MLFLRGPLLVSALVIVTTFAELENPCPSDWVQATFVDMDCLYFEPTERFSWDAAAAYCQTVQNASLLEIYTEEQFAFVQLNLEMLEGHWWTGGTDAGREGEWIWIRSLQVLPDLWFADGESDGGTERNCMYLYPSNGGFYGGPCSTSFKPICQRNV